MEYCNDSFTVILCHAMTKCDLTEPFIFFHFHFSSLLKVTTVKSSKADVFCILDMQNKS